MDSSLARLGFCLFVLSLTAVAFVSLANLTALWR
jgi:hypothetical protein